MAVRVAAVRAAVLVPGMEAFNHERFAGRELDSLTPVLEACGQLPMMAERRLVELSDPESEAPEEKRGAQEDDDPLGVFSNALAKAVAFVTDDDVLS